MRHLQAVLLLISSSCSAVAAEHWIRLVTPHFEMYTTNNEKQGAAALQTFEQVRYFFLQNSKTKAAPTTPVRIIAFRSEKEFRPYRLNEGAFAYYVRSRKADYIVMQDISPEHHQAAMHEYTHLIIQDRNLEFPLWLNEGLADLYSSLEPRGNQALVGRALDGRVLLLQSQRWLPLDVLLTVDRESPYYNEKNKMSIFYAESWALTHMLSLSKEYMAGFPQFLSQVASGKSSSDCLQAVYAKNSVQVMKDLQAYLNQASLRAAVYNIKLEKSDLEPEISEPAPLATDLALADLLATQRQYQSRAAELLLKIAAEHPESPDAEESLGYLAWNQGEQTKAQQYFKQAVEKGTKNADALTAYAGLLAEMHTPAEQMMPLLRRIVTVKPELQDAWFNLGGMAAQAGHYGECVEALTHVTQVSQERAYSLFSTKAYCYLQERALPQSREMALKARQYATKFDETLQATNALEHLDSLEHSSKQAVSKEPAPESRESATETSDGSPEAPVLRHAPKRELTRDQPTVAWSENLQHVEAVMTFFDCAPKSKRLRVTVNGQKMSFELAHPETVVIRNNKTDYIDFQCGPQKGVKVGIFYIPAAQPSPTDGEIRELVF